MMNTISIISTKGGVGKTTLCINISALLAELGFKVLVIDCDNQQSLSKFYEYKDEPINGIKEFIIDENLDSITKTHLQNVDIIINNDPSEEINKWMAESSFRTFSLSNSIKKIASQYDYIFIDTKGTDGSGEIQEMALVASNMVISPTSPDPMSSQEIFRTIKVYDSVLRGFESMGITKTIPLKIIINGTDRTSLCKDISAFIREEFNLSKCSVLDTNVPSRTVYKHFYTDKKPVFTLDRQDVDNSAINVMKSVVRELFPEIKDLINEGAKL